MERRDLAAAIYAAAHVEGEFLLRSGTVATEYFDKYQFEADPVLLRRIADSLRGSIPKSTQALAGLELGRLCLIDKRCTAQAPALRCKSL